MSAKKRHLQHTPDFTTTFKCCYCDEKKTIIAITKCVLLKINHHRRDSSLTDKTTKGASVKLVMILIQSDSPEFHIGLL